MNHSNDGKDIDRKQTPSPRPDPQEGGGAKSWLDGLNSFLDRALKADIDTGC